MLLANCFKTDLLFEKRVLFFHLRFCLFENTIFNIVMKGEFMRKFQFSWIGFEKLTEQKYNWGNRNSQIRFVPGLWTFFLLQHQIYAKNYPHQPICSSDMHIIHVKLIFGNHMFWEQKQAEGEREVKNGWLTVRRIHLDNNSFVYKQLCNKKIMIQALKAKCQREMLNEKQKTFGSITTNNRSMTIVL